MVNGKAPGNWTLEGLFEGLALDLDHEAKDSRIRQAVEPYPGQWIHHISIDSESDFDDKVKG